MRLIGDVLAGVQCTINYGRDTTIGRNSSIGGPGPNFRRRRPISSRFKVDLIRIAAKFNLYFKAIIKLAVLGKIGEGTVGIFRLRVPFRKSLG